MGVITYCTWSVLCNVFNQSINWYSALDVRCVCACVRVCVCACVQHLKVSKMFVSAPSFTHSTSWEKSAATVLRHNWDHSTASPPLWERHEYNNNASSVCSGQSSLCHGKFSCGIAEKEKETGGHPTHTNVFQRQNHKGLTNLNLVKYDGGFAN